MKRLASCGSHLSRLGTREVGDRWFVVPVSLSFVLKAYWTKLLYKWKVVSRKGPSSTRFGAVLAKFLGDRSCKIVALNATLLVLLHVVSFGLEIFLHLLTFGVKMAFKL